MSSENKFGILRRLLRALGLSEQSADAVVNFILDLLSGEGRPEESSSHFPYHLRSHFLSPAELNFYHVIQTIVNGRVTICVKVGLKDLFYVKNDDSQLHRTYTNKIDRKHVDFLLCHPKTMQPIVGIELDDSSHQRQDRKERDDFVDGVFKAARLPLIHIQVRRAYRTKDILTLIAPYLDLSASVESKPVETPVEAPVEQSSRPTCPKCGSEMILRKAKQGSNAGNRFWGCSNYPNCRTMLPIKEV